MCTCIKAEFSAVDNCLYLYQPKTMLFCLCLYENRFFTLLAILLGFCKPHEIDNRCRDLMLDMPDDLAVKAISELGESALA